MSIKDWQKGWAETEGLLAALVKHAKDYKQSNSPQTKTGALLFDDWVKDLTDAHREAGEDKLRNDKREVIRALSFEEDKLEDWADRLEQRIPNLKSHKKSVAERWRDFFRDEARLDRGLMKQL